MDKYEWLFYVALAGLAWGTYVPIIFYGGSELGGTANARLMAVLCVGAAYFVIGVVLPLVCFATGWQAWPAVNTNGLVFSGLAGVAGAVGAICVIFATRAAVDAGKEYAGDPAAYKVYIAPLIFGLAPVINVVVSIFWHPDPRNHEWAHFGMKPVHPLLWVGIVLVGLGAALVLYSKEVSEASAPKGPPPKQEPTHDTSKTTESQP
jgi:hypothetical protein